MSSIIPAKTVTLKDLETRFGLQLIESSQFFPEWQENCPEITDLEKQLLDNVKAGYLNLRQSPPLLEETIKLAVVSPLLFIGKFYLPPFELKTEYSVEIIDEDEGDIIRGNIDILILKAQLWLMAIESKQAALSVEAGLDQILAYLLAAPSSEKPCFGLITTGGTFLFIKLVKGEIPRYATSAEFSLRNPGNDLYRVLGILKYLTQIV